MKLLSLASVLMAASVSVSAQSQVDLAKLDKELEIMSSVVATALKQTNQRQTIRFRSIDSTYLANQGVIFEVKTTGSAHTLSIDVPGLVIPPVPPVAPLHIRTGDGEVLIDLDGEEWEAMFEDLYEENRESLRENAMRLREMRARSRELAWEKREIDRRKRDLEFEARSSDGDRRKDLQELLEELEVELADLNKKSEELESFANKLEQEQKQEREKRREAKQKQYNQFLASFEEGIGDMLCRFGAGLRSLPENQHISFVLKDFVRDEGGDASDRVYVFSQADVMACVQGRKSVDDLLTNVNRYTF